MSRRPRRRVAALAFLLILLSPFALLGAGEGLLRALKGAPPPLPPPWPEFENYYVDAFRPFFKSETGADGRTVWRTARAAAQSQEFAAEKAPGTFRVFVVGGSVAMHFSYPDEPTHLRETLRHSSPRVTPEVVGCGMAGYDSLRDAVTVREALRRQADAVVVMSGNNEYFLPETVNLRAREWRRRLMRLWSFRLLAERFERPPRDPTLAQRLRRFEENLRKMAREARAAGVPLVLCTLPANLRGVPPLRSRPPDGSREYAGTRHQAESAPPAQAVELWERYIVRHPEEAYGWFWLARARESAGRWEAARDAYRRALDLDDPGERTSPSRNEVVRRVAREEGAALADLEAVFESLAERRMPDGRLFIDGCHWHNEYYPLVSAEIAAALRPVLEPRGGWDGAWLASRRRQFEQPDIPGWSVKRDLDLGTYKALTYIMQTQRSLSEPALALMERQAALDLPRMEQLTRSVEPAVKAMEEFAWLRPYEGQMRQRWGEVLAHVAELHRRRGAHGRALDWAGRAAARSPDAAYIPLIRVKTLRALRRRSEAKSALGSVPPSARGTAEYAYLAEQAAAW